MKRMKRLMLILAFSPAILLMGQNVPAGMTSSEWAAQNPDKVTVAPETDAGQPGNTTNTNRQLMNGATYTYVGSFRVSDGVYWGNNPPCYTGQEAAALLFGGNPEDYAISTNPSTTDPNTITFTAWMDGWGEFVMVEYPQDYKVDLPPPGYEQPYQLAAARSAYVSDHVDFSKVNYVWMVEAPVVPVSNWALGIGILLIIAVTLFRFRKSF